MLYKGRASAVSRDMTFEVLEYNDCDETVLVAVGAQRTDTREPGAWEEQDAGSAAWWSCRSDAQPGRRLQPGGAPAGSCWTSPSASSTPCSICSAGRPRWRPTRRSASTASIFPTLYVQSHPNAPTRPRIIRDADGRQGIIGLIENGIVQPITLNPGAQVPTAIDRLERAARLAANIPPRWAGRTPTNVRTARRGASVLRSSPSDMPLQESQEIMANGKDAEELPGRAHHEGVLRQAGVDVHHPP